MKERINFILLELQNNPNYILVLFGVSCLCFGVCFCSCLHRIIGWIKQNHRAKKQAQEEADKKTVYTLPDRENTYVSERLQQALNIDREEPLERLGCECRCAEEMIGALKNASLSGVERMQVEELSALLQAMMKKTEWKVEDIRILNDCFARAIKLCAKHNVAV